MPENPRKAPSSCPHCGFVQNESTYAQSTYCRSCGEYYKIASAHDEHTAEKRPPGVVGRAVKQIFSRPPRQIHCHKCGTSHEVSGHAQITICPGCNTSIELGDLTFSSNVSRPVDTRGKLIITPSGYLNNAFIICGEGLIEGRVTGTLCCEGTLTLTCSGKVSCKVTAENLIIGKGAHVDLTYPTLTKKLTVYGHTTGDFTCEGSIRILKGGCLEGNVSARSVIVERGGILMADSVIQAAVEDEERPDDDEPDLESAA
ncbi:hypothetical protein BH09VER1_BH09VER1_33410 [soil metagenome]